MKVQDILQRKGSGVYRVTPDASVYDAIGAMAARKVGALLVMEGENLHGLISERDYRDKVALQGRTSKDTAVKDIMTSELLWVSPDEDAKRCMAIMTHRRVRHLPVLEQKGDKHRVVGILSIGDLVKTIINEQESEINNLKKYIYSGYPG